MSWTDPEKRREYDRKWRAEHPDKCREWHKKYRENHPEKEREYGKRYREEHHEQILERQRKYRAEHREEINAKRRKTKTNIPAGDGTITVDLDKRDSWNRGKHGQWRMCCSMPNLVWVMTKWRSTGG